MVIPRFLSLTKQVVDTIQSDCRNCFPMEACGFLIGTNGNAKIVLESKIAKNMSTEPNRYTINPLEYYTVEQSLEGSSSTILGFYHSHPNGSAKPSSIDRKQAWEGYSYVIVSLTATSIQATTSWIFDATTGEFFEEQLLINE